MVGSAKRLPRKKFLFGATPAINNDLSLICLTILELYTFVGFFLAGYFSKVSFSDWLDPLFCTVNISEK
jgi:hypothetical protein